MDAETGLFFGRFAKYRSPTTRATMIWALDLLKNIENVLFLFEQEVFDALCHRYAAKRQWSIKKSNRYAMLD
ncbi:hypothetical protein FOQG_08985 [Fusarium oxysporum f. sp. raphani 54005]|uniref:Uncharacterized protein n=2 Tax=Fusarium oxysporum TaxID=5507 RepID=X0C8W9_FUSOX|nr:hypothetical protein FOVG_12197 [Fusarium oxysporum f. sp. pisi HDV247]EXK87648.1 hypothetical protein FOQG_08985 [Fusarium oxysporum f. sp. raphani 54005]